MTRDLPGEALNLIGGSLVPARSGATLPVVEPATGEEYARVAASGPSDVAAAVDAARDAARSWGETPAAERSRVLSRIADLIERDLEPLALLESVDTGKPIRLARTVDIPRAVANFRFFATAILHQRSDLHETDRVALNYTLRRPHGVVGLISPWNLPLYLLSWKIAPALATGNAAVAKPSEVTPMTAFKLAELVVEAGCPPGVLNLVQGSGHEAGSGIVAHPDVKAISFTGGTATGRAIASVAGPMLKKLSLELGGKNANVVFDDADFDAAVETSVRAAFANQGQICLCGSRVFVARAIFDRFAAAFVERVKSLRVGDPLDEATQFGALVSEPHLEKVSSYLEIARQEGGEILCGGGRPEGLPSRCAGGYFLEPTVVSGLPQGCRTNTEEIFGPVVTLTPFDDEAEAVAMANATSYGLSASVWTSRLGRAHRVAESLQAGTVWVNTWLLRDLRVPFGGMKDSGVGREGGDEALRFFTETKNVCIKSEPPDMAR